VRPVVKKKRLPAAERAKAIWARFVNLKLEPHMTDQETPQPGAEEAQTSDELVETPESIAAERDRLRAEIARTVACPEQVEDELRALFAAFA